MIIFGVDAPVQMASILWTHQAQKDDGACKS